MKIWLTGALALGVLAVGTPALAQKKSGSSNGYSTGIGLRGGGWSSGLSLKHFLGSKQGVAVEGLLTREYAARGGRLTVLLEKHLSVSDFKGLQFYYGAGAHVGAYEGRYYFEDDRFGRKKNKYYYQYYTDDQTHLVGGADLILGMEYKLPDLPFVVALDYKPFFEVFRGYTGFYNDAAVTLRFVF